MSALFSLKDVALQDGKNSPQTWIIIRDIVYDVTEYLPEHPGGSELVTEYAGKDGTKEFDDFGHSREAMKLLKQYKIGELIFEDKKANRNKKKTWVNETSEEKTKKKKRRIWLFYCR